MRRQASLLTIIATSITIHMLSAVAPAQSEMRDKQLPNFHKVNRALYRGAQPRSEGMRKLSALGIKTILNLRGADEKARAEEREARAAGLQYFNVPMEGFDRPRHEQIERALEIINTEANHPVFVHCKRGADRTGTVIAIYRITQDGWSSENALREAKRHGLHWLEFGMKDYINDYGRDRAGQRTGADHGRSLVPNLRAILPVAEPF